MSQSIMDWLIDKLKVNAIEISKISNKFRS